jgi:hypothetical protein
MTQGGAVVNTREAELLEQVEHHQAQLRGLQDQASEADAQAIELDARAEDLIANFDGSVTGLPDGLQELRDHAQRARQIASDLRKRAEAYTAKVELGAIAAEYTQLRDERIAAEQLEAERAEAQRLTVEFEGLLAWVFRNRLELRAVELRLNEVGQRLTGLSARHQTINKSRLLQLPRDVVRVAGEQGASIIRDDPDGWRQLLPSIDGLELPEELREVRTPAEVWTPRIDQPSGRPVSTEGWIVGHTAGSPRPVAETTVAGPPARNPDGTLVGSSRQHWAPYPKSEEPKTQPKARSRRGVVRNEA